MRTIGRRWPATAPRGDYQAKCSICGSVFRRSQLRRDRSGAYVCPQEGAGRDAVTLSLLQARNAEAATRTRPPRYTGAFFDGRVTVTAEAEETREVSVLDAVYAEDLVLHLSANNAVVSDDGYVISIPDLSQHHNDVESFYEFGLAPPIVNSGGPNGSKYVNFNAVPFEGLYNDALTGLVAQKMPQVHMLMQVTTPASPPAAQVGERFLTLAWHNNGGNAVGLRVNTALEPDNFQAVYTHSATVESVAGAAVDRSDFFVWSLIRPNKATVRLQKDGTTIGTAGGAVPPAMRGDITAIQLPALAGDPARFRFVDLIVVVLNGDETAAQAEARIAYYQDTYGITVAS